MGKEVHMVALGGNPLIRPELVREYGLPDAKLRGEISALRGSADAPDA